MDQSDASAKPVRDFLQDWPYVSHYLQATLDPDLIALHGSAILLRALNSRRTVCFVGSGVSMSYGRLGWGELVKGLDHWPQQGEAQRASGEQPMDRHLRRWLEELDIDGRSKDDELRSGRYPAAFQFHEQLARNRARRGEGAEATTEIDHSLRQWVRELLFDDTGHGHQLIEALRKDLKGLISEAQDHQLKKLVVLNERTLTREAIDPASSGTTARPVDWRGQMGLQLDVISRLGQSTSERDGALANPSLRDFCKKLVGFAKEDEKLLDVPPLLRFVSVALARLNDELRQALQPPEKALANSGAETARTVRPPLQADPLLLLARNLGINRFITTNYDLDIERLLVDRGFTLDGRTSTTRRDDGLSHSSNALGSRARDGLFHPDRAVDLIDFSVQGADRAFDVVHLHGRATVDEQMIVTDQDYLNLYLQRGDDADLSSDAISLAFSANPMLFVGSGMSEDDILRPLRQFVAERKSRIDRKAIVLLPADGSKSHELEEVIALYSRYGVHTVHYGIGGCGTKDEPALKVRWLACFRQLAGVACAVVKKFKEAVDSPDARTQALAEMKQLARSFKLYAHLGVSESKTAEVKRCVDAFVLPGVEGRWPEIRLPPQLDVECQARFEPKHAQLELACLNALLQFAFDIMLTHADGFNAAQCWLHAESFDGFKAGRQAQIGTTLDLPANASQPPASLRRVVLMHLAIGQGLHGALLGLALTAKLSAVEQRLAEWKQGRRAPPTPRKPGGPGSSVAPERPKAKRNAAQKDNADGAKLLLRHPLALRESPIKTEELQDRAPKTDRFFSDAPSQTFQALLGAMQDQLHTSFHSKVFGRPAPDIRHRRVFVFYADRGVGKGHFFEALRTERRLGEFITWSWRRRGPPVRYAAFAYFNLSFSLEIVSAFDRISDLLASEAEKVFDAALNPKLMADLKDADEALRDNRVGRLAALLKLYASNFIHAKRRLLIALSPFNILFDERGDPKNAELYRLVTTMLDDAGANAPIDWVLICSGPPFPRPFAKSDPLRHPGNHSQLDGWANSIPTFDMLHLVRPEIGEKGTRRLEDTVSRLRVNLLMTDSADTLGATKAKPNRDHKLDLPIAYFHVLRDARTSNTVAKYFPEVALSLACHPGRLNSGRACAANAQLQFTNRIVIEKLRDRILQRASTYPVAVKTMSSVLQGLVSIGAELSLVQPAALTDGKAFDAMVDRYLPESNAVVLGGELTRVAVAAADADYRTIFRTLQRSRFLVTIACAAVSEVAWQTNPADDKKAPDLLCTATVVGWWRSLLNHLSSLQADDKGDQVVGYVLGHYQDRHDAGDELPIPIPAAANLGTAGEQIAHALRGPAGWTLQQRILWHLAVVGHPVEADVLCAAPALQRDVSAILTLAGEVVTVRANGSSPLLDLMGFVLDLMVRRCLVFRLQPAKVGEPFLADQTSGHDPTINWRFTVHRFIQRTIFRKLHAPHVEHASVDQYGLSLWATQPDDLPRPNRVAALSIAHLLADWTGFPQDLDHVMRDSAYHRALLGAETVPTQANDPRRQVTLPARLLRASLGVVRTVYSVGVLSRFHDFAGVSALQGPEEGFFEQHRLQIRWLIEQARGEHGVAGNPRLGEAVGLGNLNECRAPFFAEEVVWLYNECGLFCLVEGRLDSAAGLFAIALQEALKLEAGDKHGALWCRIHLNLAITDIERGRIREARKNLLAIRSVADENPILRLLATGYLGLVEHYSGNLTSAENTFKSVIEDLDRYGQSRSVAIFSRHLAELYRLRGKGSGAEAVLAIDRAIAAATKGGHEDVRQMSKLSRVRLAIDNLLPDESVSIQQRLDEIERYGVDMGMPRLIAETAYARAAHLLRLGETRHAARLACQCLELATAHNLRLRQMTALALLGRIHERRGMLSAARMLKARAFELANSCDYSNARDGVRRQFE